MKNYTLIKEEYIDDIKSNVKLLKHNKSGARILLIPTLDNNKTFTIGFRTPPVNDTGVPHILEHSTLCGSKKFPVKDPFVELLKSSLNTFLNAMTYPDKTIYPVASCNDKDFKNLMEVYMDAVFYPNVYVHPEIFKQEGWHYELEKLDSDITINGVVYNEMKGAFSSVESVVYREAMHLLFPDTTYGVESGGNPDAIPNLSYEEFKNFHKKYYSPANSYIILYGNCDMEERLDWMDKEYLSKFDIIDVNSQIIYQKPFDNPVESKIYYPIGKEENLEDKYQYAYSAVIGDYKDLKLCFAMQAVVECILENPGAPLKQALLDNIGVKVESSYDDGILQPTLVIYVKGSKKDKLPDFKNIINKTLNNIIKEGIDKQSLKSCINSMIFKIKESDFGRFPKGLVYTTTSLASWLYDENEPFFKLKTSDVLKELENEIDTDYFEKIIEKYILNNNHAGYIEICPSKTLSDEKELALKEKLKSLKDSVSKEELEELIVQTKELKIYQTTPSTKEELATLPKLSRSDISREVKDIYNKEEYFEKIKIIKHDIETYGIGYLTFLFSFDICEKDFNDLINLLSVLRLLSTKKYTYQELNNEINIHTGGIDVDYYAFPDEKCEPHLFVTIESRYIYGKEKETIELVQEIIKNTLFDNKARIIELFNSEVDKLKFSAISSGHRFSLNRCLSYSDKDSYIFDLASGLGRYDYITNLLDNFDDKFTYIKNKMSELCSYVFRKENLLISFTGKNDSYKTYLKDFYDSLYDNPINKTSFEFIPNVLNEGIKTPSQVQYVARAARFDENLYNAACSVFNVALQYDYLWNKVRVLGGAYGVMCDINPVGYGYFASYRDPNLKQTNDVFDGILEYLDNFNPTEEELTNYIIAAIGAIDIPCSPRQLGDLSLRRYFRKTTKDIILKNRNQIIDATVSSIKALKPIYEQILNSKNICVLGSENKIEAEKYLFKMVRNLNK